MSESTDKTTETKTPNDTVTVKPPQNGNGMILNRIIKRFGGRHLIFRTQVDTGFRILPKPYGIVSTFRGPVWFFYGLGQIWLTHTKYHEYDGWMARVPRIASPKIKALLDSLQSQLTKFTHHCNENGIEGTIIVEPTTIEFHWTFGYSLEKEKLKQQESDVLDQQFQLLVDAFLVAKKKLDT